ncbi:unnamed protein product, partial [Rotaria sp. Silwood1]
NIMNEYIQGFNNDMNCISSHYNLSGLYGDHDKRLSWVFDHETIRRQLMQIKYLN